MWWAELDYEVGLSGNSACVAAVMVHQHMQSEAAHDYVGGPVTVFEGQDVYMYID